jgi:hypothetical protein
MKYPCMDPCMDPLASLDRLSSRGDSDSNYLLKRFLLITLFSMYNFLLDLK